MGKSESFDHQCIFGPKITMFDPKLSAQHEKYSRDFLAHHCHEIEIMFALENFPHS